MVLVQRAVQVAVWVQRVRMQNAVRCAVQRMRMQDAVQNAVWMHPYSQGLAVLVVLNLMRLYDH